MITLEDIKKIMIDEIRSFKSSCLFCDDPVLAVASAEDPLFPQLKDIVAPDHYLPSDLVPKAKSVITYFIPFSNEVEKSNTGGRESSKEWDITSIEAVELIETINRKICSVLEKDGFKGYGISPGYDYDPKELYSKWSLKSAAYIAGLGTFGVHRILITSKGCCGNLGNIITDLPLKANTRPEEEYCLYKSEGTCGKCMEHCANCTFTKTENHGIAYDNQKCNDQIYAIVQEYPQGLGDFCGKCICGMPCSKGIPK